MLGFNIFIRSHELINERTALTTGKGGLRERRQPGAALTATAVELKAPTGFGSTKQTLV